MNEGPSPPKVIGTASVSAYDRKWETHAEAFEFEALPRIRATAERWAASIGAVTGVFGIVTLVRGREDVTALRADLKIAAGLLIGAALAMALAAIVLAAFAAQGTPKKLVALTGQELRRWHQEGARRAKLQLSVSRVLAVAAIVLLGAAVGITWFGPASEMASSRPKLLVLLRSGTLVCGLPHEGTAGTLTLDSAAGRHAISVATDDVEAMTVVDSCP
jgi:hypothetical protein